MKTCSKCKQEKPTERFNWANKSKGKRHYQCSDCQNKAKRKTYKPTGNPAGPPKGSSNAKGVNHTNKEIETIDPVRLLDHRNVKYLRISYVINTIRKRARKRRSEITWELSNLQAANLVVKDCFYCGVESIHKIDLKERNPYNGIDRIDSSKGYVEGNVTSCCRSCNIAKAELSHEQFLDLIKRIYNKHYQ